MNKYILRLHGGFGLGQWQIEYQDIKLEGVIWYCERQLAYFPNIQGIEIFDADGKQLYVGMVKQKMGFQFSPSEEGI